MSGDGPSALIPTRRHANYYGYFGRLIPYEWPFIPHTIAPSRDITYDLSGEVIGVKRVNNVNNRAAASAATSHSVELESVHQDGLRLSGIFKTIVALALWFFGSSARAPPAPWGLTDRALLALSLLILSQRIRSSSG
jgi:hypothetical protein